MMYNIFSILLYIIIIIIKKNIHCGYWLKPSWCVILANDANRIQVNSTTWKIIPELYLSTIMCFIYIFFFLINILILLSGLRFSIILQSTEQFSRRALFNHLENNVSPPKEEWICQEDIVIIFTEMTISGNSFSLSCTLSSFWNGVYIIK